MIKKTLILYLGFVMTCEINNLYSSLPSNETFIFVRHGSTDWNENSLSLGPQDLGLNEKGKAEAIKAAQKVKSIVQNEKNSYQIISSSLIRALDTSKIIADEIKISIHTNFDLREKYFGDFRLNKKVCSLTHQLIPVDAESDIDFQKRIFSSVKNIFSSYQGSKKIIVSHGEVFKFLSKTFTNETMTLARGGVAIFIPGRFHEKYLIEEPF